MTDYDIVWRGDLWRTVTPTPEHPDQARRPFVQPKVTVPKQRDLSGKLRRALADGRPRTVTELLHLTGMKYGSLTTRLSQWARHGQVTRTQYGSYQRASCG